MSRKKAHNEPHANHERWLVSYADFVTLLFAFFVVMYATSRSDKIKQRELAVSIQAAFTQLGLFTPASAQLSPKLGGGPAAPAPSAPNAMDDHAILQHLQQQLQAQLAGQIEKKQISLQLTRQGLVIRMQELGLFDSGSDVLRPQATPILKTIGAAVTSITNPVRIEGHTDNVPIHTARFNSNWELSTARASRLVDVFIRSYHIAPDRLSAAGYGQYRPIASNATAAGRQSNRRVDLVVVSMEAARALQPTPPNSNSTGWGPQGLWPSGKPGKPSSAIH